MGTVVELAAITENVLKKVLNINQTNPILSYLGHNLDGPNISVSWIHLL